MIDRLAVLNARAGDLLCKDIVIPIDLIYDAIEKVNILWASSLLMSWPYQKSIRVNTYISEDFGSRVILTIAPKSYVEWIT